MIHLAKEYGLSDNGLRKVCKRMEVPIPKSGYWQRVNLGQQVKKSVLPALSEDGIETYELFIQEKNKTFNNIDGLSLKTLNEITSIQELDPNKSQKLHPLIKKTKDAFKKANNNYNNKLWTNVDGVLDIRVSKDSLDRALNIFNSLIITLQNLNIETYVDTNRKTTIKIKDVEIKLYIIEKFKQKKVPLLPNDWGYNPKSTHNYKMELVPSGLLELCLDEGYGIETRKTWRDTEKQTLEHSLINFIKNINELYLTKKARELELEEIREKRQEEEKKREERLFKEHLDETRVSILDEHLSKLHKIGLIDKYIKELEQSKGVMLPSNSEVKTLKEWIDWVKSYKQKLSEQVFSSGEK
ncbi:MAG: hypothetical protein WCQ47_08170 [bacterium]